MAMLSDALSDGCRNWDTVLLKVTSVVLCAALQVRVGDITKGRLDAHSIPYLCWDDIKIQLVGGTQIEDFTATVVIRNEKKHKYVSREEPGTSPTAITNPC